MQGTVLGTKNWQGLAVLTGGCIGLGMLTSQAPLLGVGVAVAALAFSIGLLYADLPGRTFVLLLGFALVGYAFLGRPFAHIGRSPLYVGEVVLAVGLLFWVLERRRFAALRSPIAWAILGFMVLGAIRTFPYFGTYGMVAVRDAVVWIYAIFAVLVVPVVIRRDLFEVIPARYAKLLPWFLVWTPIGFVGFNAIGYSGPMIPGTYVPLFNLKGGDFGVHLAGAAAFLLLGLHRYIRSEDGRQPLRMEWLWWAVWVIGFIGVGSINRGGMLAAAVGTGVALLFCGTAALRRIAVVGAAVALVVITSLSMNLSVDLGHREISARQIANNFTSIVSDEPMAGLHGTRQWRLQWWSDVVDYTFNGRYFWEGKGFGINLADADGYQIKKDSAVRSPHNGHVTILARMGVPGIALWVLIQAMFGLALVRAFFAARKRGDDLWAKLNIWILAYWAAFLVNTAFDVYLEGPQGGIWFWSLIGCGIAALLVQERRHADSDAAAPNVQGAHQPMLTEGGNHVSSSV
jgi:hypothetical protein